MHGSIRAGSQEFRAKTFFTILLYVSRHKSDERVRCTRDAETLESAE